MHYVKIAGHLFESNAQVLEHTTRRIIGTVIPKDTPMDVLIDLQNADLLEEFDSKMQFLASYHLTDWLGMERAYDEHGNGDHLIAITWSTITVDQYNEMTSKILALQEENKALRSRNIDLINAVLELGSIIGNTEGNNNG